MLAMQASLRTAAEVPLLTARRSLEALVLATLPAAQGSHHALSDVEAAGMTLGAAINAVLLNVDVNAAMITDAGAADALRAAARELRQRAKQASEMLQQAISNRQ